MNGKIYKVTSPSGKVYIGITINSLQHRKRQHYHTAFRISSQNYNSKICFAIRKYNELLKWEIVEEKIKTYEELKQKEIYYISYFNSYEEGYNSTLGGDGKGKIVSLETRLKLSKINLNKKLSNQTKLKISNSLKGKMVKEKNPMYGKKHTEEFIISLSKCWIIVDPQDNITEVFSLKRFCKENNLAFRHMWEVANNKCLHYKNYLCFKKEDFNEQLLKQKREVINIKHPVIILINPNGIQYEVVNLNKFCKENNLLNSCISNILAGRRITHKGWTAKYLN